MEYLIDNRLPKKICPCGKVCYDKKTAVTAANKRFKEDHKKLRVYQCDQSDYFHLTKNLNNENKYKKYGK